MARHLRFSELDAFSDFAGIPCFPAVQTMLATDKIKLWVAALAVFASAYFAFYEVQGAALRLGVFLGGLVFAAALALLSAPGREFVGFAGEAGVELRKVVWPSRRETFQLTGVVFVLVSLIAVFLWFTDFVLGAALDALAL